MGEYTLGELRKEYEALKKLYDGLCAELDPGVSKRLHRGACTLLGSVKDALHQLGKYIKDTEEKGNLLAMPIDIDKAIAELAFVEKHILPYHRR